MKVNLGTQIYHVTFGPLRSKIKQKIPKEDYRLYLHLHKQVETDLNAVLDPLLQIHHKYPHIPEITNLLTYVYFQKKEIKKGEELIAENYKNNPQDLFARINYADHCLRMKKPSLIPELFEGKFDLKLLYPERELFHYSEISGFAILMSFYYFLQAKRETALEFYKVAVQVDPHAKGLIVLEKRLFKEHFFKKTLSFLRRFRRYGKLFFRSKNLKKTDR